METRFDDDPLWLRKLAERAFRLASTTTDRSACEALTLYGQELLAKAEKIESECQESVSRNDREGSKLYERR
jgi:hypothetical protein